MSDDRPLDPRALIRIFQLDRGGFDHAIDSPFHSPKWGSSPVTPTSLFLESSTALWNAADLGRPAADPRPIHLISPLALDHLKSIADADLRPPDFVDEHKNLRDSSGSLKGSIDRLGNVLDTDGRVRGSLDKFGNLRDSDGRLGGGFDRCGNFRA